MKAIKWVIQKTLAGQRTLQELTRAVAENGAACERIEVVPFCSEIQYESRDTRHPIVYGSSTFLLCSWQHPYLRQGVFYNPETFSMGVYLRRWGDNLLNADGQVVPTGALRELDIPLSEQVFVRPDGDSKAFSGTTCRFDEVLDRFADPDGSNPYLQADTALFLAPDKEIAREWRCFIVCGRVVSASRYRVHGETLVDEHDTPADMIVFAEEMCRLFAPHDVFVMDVALYGGRYKIVECNCFNGTGTYRHDWNRIIRSIHTYVQGGIGQVVPAP